MKKNITINIFGQLYAFDEDAYELLKNYEDSLRSAFSSQPGGHEIADEIRIKASFCRQIEEDFRIRIIRLWQE